MKKFLIKSKAGVSEWIEEFSKVQEFMNELERTGTLKAKVQLFQDNVMRVENSYSWNGVQWELINTKMKTF